jgi:oxygen-dependent protoporphyrinogen oxidase
LDPVIGIRKDPEFLRTYRWHRGIPQYTIGHIERRSRLEELVGRRPGLHIVGNAYYGVSLNDCVKMAHGLAQKIGAKG